MTDKRDARLRYQAAATLLVAWLAPGLASAQSPVVAEQPPAPEQPDPRQPQTVDVFDLIRLWRHKTQAGAEQPWDHTKPMTAFAPVIGAKPANGLIFGVAGNVASFRGNPATTHISTTVLAATYTTKKQTALSGRFTLFGRDDRWRVEGDNRAQWTSQDAYGLGTGTSPSARLNAQYDFFRVYDTACYRLARSLFAGLGFHLSVHSNIGPGSGADEEAWEQSPYMTYTEEHGFPLEGQTSAGPSLNLLFDSRDNQIAPSRGWFAQASYRAFFKDVLGGDSSWQELYLDTRTYIALAPGGRKTLALWGFADLVAGGHAPYFDLPATGMDTYGRSGRGYGEGRYRGERMVYAEVEYRRTLTRNGLLGMVVFANLTTVTNLETGERLFDTLAPGVGAGVRLLMNKRSRTNICLDVGFGKEGSRGVYLAIQEAF